MDLEVPFKKNTELSKDTRGRLLDEPGQEGGPNHELGEQSYVDESRVSLATYDAAYAGCS